MSVSGTATTCTVRGTTVPTLIEKLTLVTRGALEVSTVERICVFCSVVRLTPPLDGALPVVCAWLLVVVFDCAAAPDFVVSDFVSVALRCEDGCAALFESDLVESEDFIGAFEGSDRKSTRLNSSH